MDATIAGELVDFNPGIWTDEEALEACAWAAKRIRERIAQTERQQLALFGGAA
jgi:hypothetical protein